MLDFLNDFFHVLGMYVSFVFDLEFLPGISIGAFFLVAMILYVFVKFFWI